MNVVFLSAPSLAQVGIALASSLSGWLNAVLLAVVLRASRALACPIGG